MALRLFRTAVLAAVFWNAEQALGQAACSTFVAAQAGDTCLSLSSLAGISVTQFLRNNPQVTSCDKLNAGDNYCVEQSKSTSTGKVASPATTSTAPSTGGLVITTDGHCGDGFTCVGSAFGQCCSEHGWCGDSEEHCGPKCQQPFGKCAGSGSSSSTAPTSPAGGTASRVTVTVTTTIVTTQTAGNPIVSTTIRTVSATVTLPGITLTKTTTAPGATVTVPTTVTGVGATRTVTVSSAVTLPAATVTVISVVRTTLTVATTSFATETETATETTTHNVFRTITVMSTEYSTATETAVVPTTIYRTQTQYVTATATLPGRTYTVTDWATVTKLETTTAFRTTTEWDERTLTRTVVSTATVNVAVPYTATVTLLRTVTLMDNRPVATTTITALKTVTLNNNAGYTITVHQIETMTVFKTITAPGGYNPGGGDRTVTRTVTICDDIWKIGG